MNIILCDTETLSDQIKVVAKLQNVLFQKFSKRMLDYKNTLWLKQNRAKSAQKWLTLKLLSFTNNCNQESFQDPKLQSAIGRKTEKGLDQIKEIRLLKWFMWDVKCYTIKNLENKISTQEIHF
jgi:hypothetical protein